MLFVYFILNSLDLFLLYVQWLGVWAEIEAWDVGQRLGTDTSRTQEISYKMKILMVPKEANGAELWVGPGFSGRVLA